MTDGSAVRAASVPRWRIDARVRTMRGKTFVAGPREARELDETAAFIWRMLDGTRTVQQIAEAVCAEYAVDAGTAVTDVTELVTELIGCGVVELSPAAA